MKIFSSVPLSLPPERAFKALAGKPHILFLDSADQKHPASRYSYIMANPVEFIEARGDALYLNGKYAASLTGVNKVCPFDYVAQRMGHYDITYGNSDELLPPFCGGAAGFFGYDLGRRLEKIPEKASKNPEWPDMAIGIYDTLYAYDHHAGKGLILSRAKNKKAANINIENFQKILETEPEYNSDENDGLVDWQENFDQTSYEKIIRQTIEYIYSGDIFQANITRRFDAELPENYSPEKHYETLRNVNPAPFAAYFDAGVITLASASPERFLICDASGFVQTNPIKGTRPHYADDLIRDRAEIQDLLSSDKDRAENTMIVDLLRNDLSKSCIPRSIEVPHLCALESFANVHHLVSTITGQLRPDKTSLDLLKGCFPGGSITGAPKIRAMEIIEELEPTRRGPYCGALGYIGFDGAMDMNILIRTLIFERGKVSFQVGGGIVADSDPAEEFTETLTKAYGILNSFKA